MMNRHLPLALLLLCAGAAAQTQDTTVTYSYDDGARLKTVNRPLGRKTDYGYDQLGRRKTETVTVAGGTQLTTLGLDRRDQVTAVTDPRTLATAYTVDGLGNKSAQSSPDTGASSYTYDEDGQLKTMTDARGKTTTYSYDVLGRLTGAAYQSGAASLFEYDGGAGGPAIETGNLTRITDESGFTTYSHDLNRRVLTKSQTVQGSATFTAVVGYTYGPNGKVATMTYPSGARINYDYDANGRVSALRLNPADGAGGTNLLSEVVLLSAISYTPSGQMQGWTWGDANLPAVVRSYDLDGRSTAYPVAADGMLRTVSYNAASLITAYTHSGGANPAQYDQTFGYDLADRLTSFTLNGQTTTYTYDADGNRIQQNGPGGTYTYSTTSNRLASATVPAPRSYGYDAAGNRTSDGVLTYAYSDRGRLAQVNGAGVALNFLYNGIGQRVAKLGGASGAVYYAYDEEGRTVGEYVPTAQQSVETVHLGALPVAALTPAGQFYVFADHLNAPVTLWSPATAATVWGWRSHDPFGNNAPTIVTAALPYFNLRFPGQVADQDTGLFYNYFRNYDPQTARYIESDPIGLDGGVNSYVYAAAQPISRTDSSGLDWVVSQSRGTIELMPQNGVGPPQPISSGAYTGHGIGVNNPALAIVPSIGPIPIGKYSMGPEKDNRTSNGHVLTSSIRLTPDSSNWMFNRGGFLVHGDNRRHDRSASEGCIIVPKDVRDKMGRSSDKTLTVVP